MKQPPYEPIRMWLQCVKARDEARVHVPLWFDGRFQTFTLRDASKPSGSSAREGRAVSRPRSAGRVGAAAKAAIPTEEKPNDPWLT